MPVFGPAKVEQWYAGVLQHFRYLRSPLKMRTVNAPGDYDLIRAFSFRKKILVVFRSNRVLCPLHRERIGIAPCKDVCHAKGRIPQPSGAAFASFDRGVVPEFIGNRRVQHDEIQNATGCVPPAFQKVTIRAAVRIFHCGIKAVGIVRPDNHSEPMPSSTGLRKR